MKLSRLLLFFLLMPFITHAQTSEHSNLDALAEDFLKYLSSFDKEKIQLQTDRHIYAAGETVYFKAFLIDSMTNRLRGKPKKLYADLVNDHDSVLGQILLNASNLKTAGEFVLNDSLDEGYYWVRVYPQETLENRGLLAVTPLYIINASRRSQDELPEKKEDIEPVTTPVVVQLFPEGGHIISAINSTVALKVTDGRGNPVEVRGIVEDNADSVYATFSTNSEGLSKFSINPLWYHRYTVRVLNNSRYDSITILPAIDFYAAQLAVVQQTDTEVKVRVALEDSIYTKDYPTYLFAISGDSICYSAVGKGMYEVQIPLNNFSHGISRLLLFNSNNQLISERDIFIKKENYQLSIHPDKNNYGAREHVRLDISLTDQKNKPLLAALALAVTDMRVTDTTLDNCMRDTMQRFSDHDADLIMLTHKSNFTNWSATDVVIRRIIDSQKIFPDSPAEKNSAASFSISGTVFNKKNEPVAKKLVTIFSNTNSMFINTDTTDINGKFRFSVPDYSDSTRFVVQVSNLKGKKQDGYQVVFDTMRMPRFATPLYMKKKFVFNEKLNLIRNELYYVDSFQIGSGSKWLKPVVINRYKKKKADYDETKRVSPFSHIITHKMLSRGAHTTGNALLMVPGVHSTGNSIAIGGPVGMNGQFVQPLIILNGVAVGTVPGETDIDLINAIPPQIIDFIEVLTGPEGAIYGLQGGNGVILINTTNHTWDDEPNLTGLSSFYPRGFHAAQSFGMRDYNNKETKASKMPDLRTTIYWDGNIITNADGKASVNFFTADNPGTYLVTITGISEQGDKIYQTLPLSRN